MNVGALRFLDGGGQMGEAIAGFDWSATPLGPIAEWEPALKVSVGMMVNSAFPKCLCWGPELISLYNDAFVPILRAKHPCLGRPFSEIWDEAWDDIRAIVNRAMAGRATFIEDFAVTIKRSDRFEEAYFTFCYSPVRDEHGEIRAMLNTVMETTGKVRAERMTLVKARELTHRNRNTYALVSALVNQTCRTSTTIEEVSDKIRARLGSLVQSQDMLAEKVADAVTVAEVVERALEPFAGGSGSVEFSGPRTSVGRNQVTTLMLALHELATNAAKYGALSTESGRVLIRWKTVEAPDRSRFILEWTESGGPAVEPPTRRGFGSALIEDILSREMDGDVEIEMPAEGLFFRLTCDVASLA